MEEVRHRLGDVKHEDGGQRNPLQGLFPANMPVPGLEEALTDVSPMVPTFTYSSNNRKIADRQAKIAQREFAWMSLEE